MRKRLFFISILLFFFSLSFDHFATPAKAYIDLSDYKVKTGKFENATKAKEGLNNFIKTTGWKATIQESGQYQNYYTITSGGFVGENHVKEILKDFKSTTGFNAAYVGIGEPVKSYKVQSDVFDENKTKGILAEFQKSTGINATYIGIGEQKKYYEVISGGFIGKNRTMKVLQSFESSTGIKASYISIGKDRYRIKSEPILNSTKITKARSFFLKNKWSFTSHPTGTTGYENFRITTDSLVSKEDVNKALSFFQKNNLKAETVDGKKIYHTFRIKTSPILGLENVNKAANFFKSHSWSYTRSMTGNRIPIYELVTSEFSDYNHAQAAIKKIKTLLGWSATAVKTKNGPQLMYTNYGLTLNSMLDKEMALNPQTDKYRNVTRYVYASYVDMGNNTITADNVNIRSAPSTNGTIVQHLNKGDEVIVLGKTGDWVKIRITWQSAQASDVNYYLKASNFTIGSKSSFQFLKLSESANLSASEVNVKILKGKGILDGKGQSFIDAAKKYHINEIYLISHSLLETGNGTSKLAAGVEYNGKIVYNMYGYGAFDSCPLTCGAKTAYDNQWFTPEAAIIGGAQFISSGYIHNSTFQQDTLYKMRWNPTETWHQYATDVGWAYKQVSTIYDMYHLLGHYTLYFDVPKYQ